MSAIGISLPDWADAGIGLPELLRGMEERRRDRGAHTPASVAAALGAVGRRFAVSGDSLRTAAIAALREDPGYSGEMAELVLDGMAREWTPERLLALVHSEFGRPALTAAAGSTASDPLRCTPVSPAIHVCAGNVPGVSVTSLIRGLLAGSAVLIKPGRSDRALPTLFHQALCDLAPELAEVCAVRYWDAGEPGVVEVLGAAGLVVTYGGDDAIRFARTHAGPTARLVEYPHRISVLLVTSDGLKGDAVRSGAEAAATAISTFEQRGCVSPQAVFVLEEGELDPGSWAEILAGELARAEVALPPGRRTPAEASAFHQESGVAEMEAASDPATRVWGTGTGWRVVFEATGEFRPSCLGRFVRVYPVRTIEAASRRLAALAPHLQTVGVVGTVTDIERAMLVRSGALRVVNVDHVPWPPIWARLDGIEPLRSLVRWVYAG